MPTTALGSQKVDVIMRNIVCRAFCALSLILLSSHTMAASALSVLGKDYMFPNEVAPVGWTETSGFLSGSDPFVFPADYAA
ncbi:MAG: hypothetical protein P4M05_27165 [Bradyrhizobium sp.]|nr:hypothetical protein [Bradyrhizobium sp.]